MAAPIVTIICIAMIVVGGMTLSQGILTSTDSAATSVEAISVREGDMMRTNLDIQRAAQLSWSDYLRLTVINSGQVKLASYDKWDLIVSYTGIDSATYSTWLPYSSDLPGNNEWQNARIGLRGPVEYFEPGILNPGEEMVILARLDPLPGAAATGDISLTTPNGIYNAVTFAHPGYLRLTPQSEDIVLANKEYYELVESSPADGEAITAGTSFSPGETGRKLLNNTGDASRAASFVYPLTGISEIPADDWTFIYRCYVFGGGDNFPTTDNDISFNVDIVIRQANGTVRATIATGVATAYFNAADKGVWVTITGAYTFPGYTVTDGNDYLEIDFYGETSCAPEGAPGYLQLSIDDSKLPMNDQTRIEAL